MNYSLLCCKGTDSTSLGNSEKKKKYQALQIVLRLQGPLDTKQVVQECVICIYITGNHMFAMSE